MSDTDIGTRYVAQVEYDGSAYCGWQRQKTEVRTIQGELEKALSKVADHQIEVTTAGRTDTGVHATHQVIHFDGYSPRSEFSWCRGANRFLPHDIRLQWVVEKTPEFHARFSALSRSYRFIIYNHSIASAVYRNLATHEFRSLDRNRMAEAGLALLGEHDFSSFRAAGCQASSPVRTVQSFEFQASGAWIWFDITANAFLQHMVRTIAGTLIEIGCRKRPVGWMNDLLEVRDRTQGSITAPASGLYLIGVDYPTHWSLPSNRAEIGYWAK